MRNQVLSALKKIQAGERPAPELGICANVYELMYPDLDDEELEEELYMFLEEMFPRWPNHSGNECYPVEGDEVYFWSVEAKLNRWNPEDDHGALRLDLLAWLIEELSK